MINADMRQYDYYTYGEANDYGQAAPPDFNKSAQGSIKIAIYTTSESVQNNINYKDAQYIGLTHDDWVDDTYIIVKEKERLKVLYVDRVGIFKRVYLGGM